MLCPVAGKEAAAEALGALVWVSFGDPEQRDAMRGKVKWPASLQQFLGLFYGRLISSPAAAQKKAIHHIIDAQTALLYAREPMPRVAVLRQVLPALLHLLGATKHDGCRCAALAALRTMASSPGTSDFRCCCGPWHEAVRLQLLVSRPPHGAASE